MVGPLGEVLGQITPPTTIAIASLLRLLPEWIFYTTQYSARGSLIIITPGKYPICL
jgi:hypothetical protein